MESFTSRMADMELTLSSTLAQYDSVRITPRPTEVDQPYNDTSSKKSANSHSSAKISSKGSKAGSKV